MYIYFLCTCVHISTACCLHVLCTLSCVKILFIKRFYNIISVWSYHNNIYISSYPYEYNIVTFHPYPVTNSLLWPPHLFVFVIEKNEIEKTFTSSLFNSEYCYYFVSDIYKTIYTKMDILVI